MPCHHCHETYTTRAPVAAQRIADAKSFALNKKFNKKNAHVARSPVTFKVKAGTQVRSTCLQSRGLSDVRMTPLRQMQWRMCEMTIAAARRIYKHTIVSAKQSLDEMHMNFA
jgi:hypothetical protein